MIKISELYLYPVKSLAGIKLNTAKLSPFGLQYDRRWMIVDPTGKFISQRELAKMATIKTKILDGQLILSHLYSELKVPSVDGSSKEMSITVWKDTFQATHVSKQADSWLSGVLQQDCQLVYMQDDVQRQIDLDFAPDGQNVSFADADPLLVSSQASLDDLNSRLKEPVNINR
ncbi:MAG: MOSC N-terminal beta barrel domain-containing protein, partial [Proteobacteria bacterium]|nr:MOSC N-terminal beta barrel domain-containing protein [Pseudomonadota bacterium]